jgi:peroxiredoxin Q/BCP
MSKKTIVKKTVVKKPAVNITAAKKTAAKKTAAKKTAAKKPAAKKTAVKKASVSSGALIEPKKLAPNFTLVDGAGVSHSLADYVGSAVILYFYPRDNTPGCTQEACQFRDLHAAVKKRNGVVLGISPDSQSSHASFAKKFKLPFVLLVDEPAASGTPAVSNAYGVWQEKSMYGKSYMGIVRTTYLIGADRKVVKRWDKVSVADHGAEVLAALGEIG